MIRLLSYIYPISKKVKSLYNGDLKIVWFNGKKLLDSKNANYSYGSLQEILQIGVAQFDVLAFKKILVLGLGGGSIITILRNEYLYKEHITAIEIDPEIIKIAEEEFHIKSNNKLKIVCADAYDFVLKNKVEFDFVIIDLFIDNVIPAPFFSTEFWEHLANTKQLLFNASLHQKNEKQLKKLIVFLKQNGFTITQMNHVLKTNTLLIIKK